MDLIPYCFKNYSIRYILTYSLSGAEFFLRS